MKNFYTDLNGNTYEWETPDAHVPLDTAGVIATLNAVLGIWALDDAANAVGLTAQQLTDEALAWGASQILQTFPEDGQNK